MVFHHIPNLRPLCSFVHTGPAGHDVISGWINRLARAQQRHIGNALTPMVQAFNDKALAEDPNAELQPSMQVEDAARSVLHMAELPPGANVQFMTVMATKMPFIGRG